MFLPTTAWSGKAKTLPVGAAGFEYVGKSGRLKPKTLGWGAKNRVLFMPSVQ